jgi:hypothetical protein
VDDRTDADVLHQLKNHLAVIVGFTDLLLAEAQEGDPRTADLREVHNAARQAMAVLPDVAKRLRIAALEDQE